MNSENKSGLLFTSSSVHPKSSSAFLDQSKTSYSASHTISAKGKFEKLIGLEIIAVFLSFCSNSCVASCAIMNFAGLFLNDITCDENRAIYEAFFFVLNCQYSSYLVLVLPLDDRFLSITLFANLVIGSPIISFFLQPSTSSVALLTSKISPDNWSHINSTCELKKSSSANLIALPLLLCP